MKGWNLGFRFEEMKVKITQEDLFQMRAMRQQGLTLSAIAGKYRCSLDRIHRVLSGKAKRIEISPQCWTETVEAKRILDKPSDQGVKMDMPRLRQKRSGTRPRRENLELAELNMALTNWLKKRGLLNLSYREYWGGMFDKYEN